jgi:hypothetical protein
MRMPTTLRPNLAREATEDGFTALDAYTDAVRRGDSEAMEQALVLLEESRERFVKGGGVLTV